MTFMATISSGTARGLSVIFSLLICYVAGIALVDENTVRTAAIGFGVMYLVSLIEEPPELLLQLVAMAARLQPWLFMAFVLVCVLIPLSMTMSLLWKTKESILTSVFHSRH